MPLTSKVVIDLLCSYRKEHQCAAFRAPIDDIQIDHLYRGGLASVALVSLDPSDLSDYARDTLKSADLTSEVIYQQICETTFNVLELADEQGIPTVLIKGISVSEELYAKPHHRVMGDVDILAANEKAEQLYESMRESGYLDSGSRVSKVHHHLPELCHPVTGVPIEVHTSLFSRTLFAREKLFQASTFWSHTRASDFFGRRCLRFSPEYQFVYGLAHWAIDYKWPRNLISINDLSLMLRRKSPSLDWELISGWLVESPLVSDMLAVLLLFFEKAGVASVPAAIESEIALSAKRIGRTNLAILHWLLLKFPISGRRKVAWALTRSNARVIWVTLLEPRHKMTRLIVATKRILLRRTRGESLLNSTTGRIRTLLKPNN